MENAPIYIFDLVTIFQNDSLSLDFQNKTKFPHFVKCLESLLILLTNLDKTLCVLRLVSDLPQVGGFLLVF